MSITSRNRNVSVVIPSYRAAGTICRAIDSVLAQSAAAAEIIVVDDGSPDDTAAMVQRNYGERVILIRQANGGAASARNAGIEQATGDFIAFLDADDYWEPQKLERQLALFERHPDVGLVAGRYFQQLPGERRNVPSRKGGDPVTCDTVIRVGGPEAFRSATAVWTGTVLVRSEALSAERFSAELQTAEDRDLWVRIVAKHPMYFMSEPLATAVLEPGSLSRGSIERDCTNMLRMVERHRELLGPSGVRLWRSHTLYRWAANDPNPCSALPRLAQSLWLWPLPYWEIPEMGRFARLRRIMALLAKLFGIR